MVSHSLPFVTAYQAARQLEVLGDPTRRAIFERLANGPLAVGELAQDLPVSRPAVSQHLRALKDVGLVTDRADGTRRLYAIDREGLAVLRSYFDRFWDDALDAFRRAAEQSHAGPRGGKRAAGKNDNRNRKEKRK
jgi:DNA-binding transcriptional ArsR family regulator